MKKYLQSLALLLAALMMPTAGAAASTDVIRGDVNQDGSLNIADVTVLIDCLLTNSTAPAEADCNLDNNVNIADVTVLIDYLLSGQWPYVPEPGEDYVDLGLPSGTLWATHNVGATSPEEYGDHFAWGETETKEYYWWNTYKWGEIGENNQIIYLKYNTKSNLGPVDDKTELDPEDDAAYVNMGPSWRMPSREQVRELYEYCTWEWTQVNGVNGELLTGPSGNKMFLPAAGIRLEYDHDYAGVEGFYWGRSLCIIGTSYVIPENGDGIIFDSEFDPESNVQGNGSRMNGCSVRAVFVP